MTGGSVAERVATIIARRQRLAEQRRQLEGRRAVGLQRRRAERLGQIAEQPQPKSCADPDSQETP